ncbi:MAG: GNAT family N-acetyltransferase [Rhodobacteraceae bacterium]|nr:GNAT family N-acetyltransferase [Paracoccaceae bacterium]
MEIRPMSLQDLELALDWAAGEGWNPGLDDATAFYEADPDGFLMGWHQDIPVAAISAIRHSAEFGFLGLYICHSAYRGRGFGWQIWQAAMRLFGERMVGLDGVLDQQENYARSGFSFSHNTLRYQGNITAKNNEAYQAFTPDMLDDCLAIDRRIADQQRPRYLSAWLKNSKNRTTLLQKTIRRVEAMGTIRRCAEGFKIGPLYAENTESAEALIAALLYQTGEKQGLVSIDVPSRNQAANAMCRGLGMVPVFSTARMYKGGKPPKADPAEFGVMTLELG